MGWNEKYWDALSRYYWSPSDLGLRSIPRKLWKIGDDLVCVPRDQINEGGPLYSRHEKAGATWERLRRSEETLNEIFDLTFAIAPDSVVEKLLFEPLDISDTGPFQSLGNEVSLRYGWGDANVTMHDGLFASSSSLVCVELKLKSPTSPGQLAKYLALLVSEERHSHKRTNLGLLFIAPSRSINRVWSQCGLQGPRVDDQFLLALPGLDLNRTVRRVLEENDDDLRSAADRLRLAVISWDVIFDAAAAIMRSLDQGSVGEQTLFKLLQGFVDQMASHDDTGIRLAGV